MDKTTAAKIAAKWWTEQVRAEGIRFGKSFGFPSQSREGHLVNLTEQHLSAFEQVLFAAICDNIRDENWREDSPNWGSYTRTVGSDYGPDATLAKAFDAVGISTLLCPNKTILHINPDRVFSDTGSESNIDAIEWLRSEMSGTI